LDVVGDGPARSEHERAVRDLRLGEKVTFKGLLEKRAVAALMREADLFVLPSLWDNMPCALVEALASGLPVISTSVGGIQEIVLNGSGILVAPGNSRALAAALEEGLRRLPEFNRAEIEASARRRYSLAAVSDELHAVYRAALAESSVVFST
jgi:glycosyltransferase involved in cell wall biosynthesis